MKRNVSLEDISDGRLYSENDMVRADCHDCRGCSACCRGMGKSVILDPYDVYRLTLGLKKTMQELLMEQAELNVVDGVVLPNLRMMGKEEQCGFLDPQGRCSIHPLRPGICRLFPLGRYYENGSFRYFLQTVECNAARSKIKISKWIDTPRLDQNSRFVIAWHYLLNQIEDIVRQKMAEQTDNAEDDFCRQLNMFLLQNFYLTAYDGKRDFYEQFEERMVKFRQVVPE